MERLTACSIKCVTWNLHGKGLDHISTLLTGMEMPSDVFLLQELGDVRGLALGFHREDFVTIAGREFVAYIANPDLSHRCTGVLIACDLEFRLSEVHVHGISLSLCGCMMNRHVFVASLHFPHEHRSDVHEVWRGNIATLQDSLVTCDAGSMQIIGHDLNQDVHATVDGFEGMVHYRQMLARTGLEPSPPQGPTWVARGLESSIDFLLYKIPSAEVSFWIREDLRLALPSDHNAVGMAITLQAGRTPLKKRPRQSRCGKWSVDGEQMWGLVKGQQDWDQDGLMMAAQAPGVSARPKSLKYVDSGHIKDLIQRRKHLHEQDAKQHSCKKFINSVGKTCRGTKQRC